MIVQTSQAKGRESEYDRKPAIIFKPSGRNTPAKKRPSLVEALATTTTTTTTTTTAVTATTADDANNDKVLPPQYSTDNPLYHSYVPACSPDPTAPTGLARVFARLTSLRTSAEPNLGTKQKTAGGWKRKFLARSTTLPADEGSEEVFLPRPAGDEPCLDRDAGRQRSENEYMNIKEAGAFAARSADGPAYCWTAGLAVLNLVVVALAALIVLQLLRTMPDPKEGSAGGLCTAMTSSGPVALDRGWQLPEDGALCLPCLDVYLTSLEVRQNRGGFRQKTLINDSMLCCVESHDNLQRIFKEYVSVQYRTRRANGKDTVPGGTDQMTPDQHLLLAYNASTTPEVRNGAHVIPLNPVVSSTAHRPQDFILLQNATLSVKREGHYYMYSDIPFHYFVSPSSTDPDRLKQEVVKVRNGGEEIVLLENSVLPCDLKSKQSCRMHSFASGTFWLVVGDSIFVQVSADRNIIKDEIRFGLYPI